MNCNRRYRNRGYNSKISCIFAAKNYDREKETALSGYVIEYRGLSMGKM